MNTLVDSARAFAIGAHNGIKQVRKYTHEPYWKHPEAVVEIVKTVPHTDSMLAAAWLHDVVEDTPITLNHIKYHFGDIVAAYVDWLTDKDIGRNRKERKANEVIRLAKAPVEVKTIKLADLIHNTESIVAHDPDFARVYIREKAAMVRGALFDGNPMLVNRALTMIANYEFSLETADARAFLGRT